jgi:hypothetical protein
MRPFLAALIAALLFLSPFLEFPEPTADWYGLAYIMERLRQQDINGWAYVVDVRIKNSPAGHVCVTTYYLPDRGWVEVSVPVRGE